MPETKAALRQRMRRRCNEKSAAATKTASQTILRRLLATPEYQAAGGVFCYVALPGEVDTRPLLDRVLSDGKTLAVPRTTPDGLISVAVTDPVTELVTRGHYGVTEPEPAAPAVPLESIHLVIVPGLAFDRRGNRLGHGKGYFDRFLADLPEAATIIGLAFSWQLVAQVPTEPHDVRVGRVISD